MPASPFDSTLYRDLLGDPELARLFTDSADIRAMLIVEGALAKVQGAQGLIPEVSAKAIHRASLEVQIDPVALTRETGQSAVPIPALVAAFRKAMEAPEHADYIHWGATSQDIVDTALMLRMKQVLAILETRVTESVRHLADLADTHADTPMAARTWGQPAVPTTFGAVAAGWGHPLLDLLEALPPLRDRVLAVSLSGAAGTGAAMGAGAPGIRADLARALGLADPGRTWHSDRGRIADLAHWLDRLCQSLGKIGDDLIWLTAPEMGELGLAATGGSSTMPHKANPVAPSALSALARHAQGLAATIAGAARHTHQRDGAAWMAEWLALPGLCCSAGRASLTARDLLAGLAPDPARMARNLAGVPGTLAEALSFALAAERPRAEAKATAAALVAEAQATGTPLPRLIEAAHPDLDPGLGDPATALGHAPAEARAFAQRARANAARTDAP